MATNDEINEVAQQICDDYCKWREAMQGAPEQQVHMIYEVHCENCPLNRIVT